MRLAGKTWIPDDDSYFAPIFEAGDVFEPRVLECGLKHVKDWSIAVDGGAHVGSWTRALASRFDKVLAFEPHPDNFGCLLANIDGLLNVLPRRMALGWRVEYFGLESGRNSGCWHVAPGKQCMAMPLDDFRLPRLGYLKLDIEGFEGFALRGAEKTVQAHWPVVQIEEKALPHSYDGPIARELLESWGYRQVDAAGRDVIFAKE